MPHDPLVTTDWLQQHLRDPGLRVVDIRGSVTTRPLEPGVEEATYRGAPDEYLAGHIPGAVYVDWTRDIVDPDDPVPAQVAPPDRFAEAMSDRGVGDATHVVAVDHMGGQFATRLWWALTYYGHDAVSVLDGGWNRWVEEGRRGRVGGRRRRARHVPPAAQARVAGLGRRRPGAARPGRPPAHRRPRPRPVHRRPPPGPARRPHPRRDQPAPRAVLRRRGRVPPPRGDPPPRRGTRPPIRSADDRLLQRRRRRDRRPVQPRPARLPRPGQLRRLVE